MPVYQLHRMNPHSGHIDRTDALQAGDDVEAVYLAGQRRGDVPLELWREGRKIVRIDAKASLWARYQAGDLPRRR